MPRDPFQRGHVLLGHAVEDQLPHRLDVTGSGGLTTPHPASVRRARVTRRLSGLGSRCTQPRPSSLVITWESRESEEFTVAARSLMVRTWSSASESIAMHR